MITESDFIDRFSKESEAYNQWGKFVTTYIEELIAETESAYFFKIPPTSRVKDIKSLVAKAFYRGKHYNDPYNDITDKVGTRFVVLLLDDIEKVKTVVESCNNWGYSLDRDFNNERLLKPTLFEYQSVHYVVRNKIEFTYNHVLIPQDITCEIQIRTLLQHAYSELTHDIIYKPTCQVPPEVYRAFATSMALIETTDSLFSKAYNITQEATDKGRMFLKELLDIYKTEITAPDYADKLNTYIYDEINQLVDQNILEDIKTFIRKRIWLKNVIISQSFPVFPSLYRRIR